MPGYILRAYEKIDEGTMIGLLTLNRPDALNALSPEVMEELCDALEEMAKTQGVRAVIIAGSPRVFAAGADILAMVNASPMDIIDRNTLQYWQRIRAVEVPLLAAVSGYALGGGCELAMACDIIIASETALFGQPEVKVGIMPGAGGTQRLAKAIGPYRAMEMVLTGEPITAAEAYAYGLVNRVVPVERFLEEAKEIARTIAQRPPVSVRLARQALRHGVETTLREGMEIERKNFTLLFDTHDQKEGMEAFLEKRPPRFRGA